ncbi:MAG: flagellar hook protein FlgE [Oligoflexales bacterium]|nr:flagellar hook protein FlgE [Oligoflexales bacterium]
MGVAQTLYTGVTGLSVNADGMAVVANNIANANAKGFKKDRAEFEDILAIDLNGGSAGQIGRGARLGDVRTIHSQGGMKVTDNLTDLAIQGSGFFVVTNPSKDVNETAGKSYSRVGNLHFDKDGYFATPSGGRVQGFMADGKGVLSSKLTDVRIETNTIAPRATETLTLNVQLDARAKVIQEPFSTAATDKTSNFSTTATVFDSYGKSHQNTIFFRKTAASAEGVEWEWHSLVDGKEVTDSDPGVEWKEIGMGKIKFDKFGLLLDEQQSVTSANFANGALPNQQIKVDFGQNVGVEAGRGIGASTSIAGDSVTTFHQQDGYEAGQIKSLDIGQDGKVTGVFTNGVQRVLAGIALATFPNEIALLKLGKNLFSDSIESGPANIGLAQTGTRGSLYSSTLEESNVDLASEFVDMITTQRLFQANSRSITTADGMLEEVINLKR